MSIEYNELSMFSVEGCRVKRNNPDGTQSKVERTVGGVGTFDVSGAADTSAIPMTVKFDNGTPETKNVDLSSPGAVVDETKVTVAELVTALTTAAFTNVTATKEAVTNRIKLDGSASSADYMQVYGALAGYIQIGGTKTGSTLGTKMLKYFDGTLSIGESKNVKEGEQIEQESGAGQLRTVITDDVLKGENPTISISQNDYEMKELVMGGVYDATAKSYTPRTTADTDQPEFYIESFTPMYSKGTSKQSSKPAYEKKVYYSAAGIIGDVSKETKAWVPLTFNLKATESLDENGATIPPYREFQISDTEFEALDVENV